MFVLFIVLNDTDYLDDILATFVELGVKGATILDSQGMGSIIVSEKKEHIPLFGALKVLLDGSRPYNKTIFTVLENEELVENTVAAVQDVMEYSERHGAGFMFTIPVGNIYKIHNYSN